MGRLEIRKPYWIEFIGDRSVQIREGETILAASLRAGIPHYHACGGKAKCSTCRVLIIEGETHLTPYTKAEARLRKSIPLEENVRLACQTYVNGNSVKLHRIIRDESDRLLYTSGKRGNQEMGEERDLALFFLDIRDFTPFMQKYLPFDVIHILRRLFQLFRDSIEKYKGRIIDTAGDGFYAVFGFRSNLTEAVDNAVKAGLMILKELEDFNLHYMDAYFDHQFEIGIGIHAGRVITGSIGLGVNNNITVMGLPVNIAARLQDATKDLNNNFIISAEAADLLPHRKHGIPAQVILKGIPEAVPVYLIGTTYR